jgi:hypothetical protein
MHPPQFLKFFALSIFVAAAALAPADKARAQELPEGIRIDADGVPRFDGVTEERVRPDDTPDAELIERPGALFENPVLPEAPTEEALRRLASVVTPRTVEIVAQVMPPQPYRQVPMLYRGHAVWLSSKEGGKDPILVSTLDWLQGAEAIYLIPDDPAIKRALPAAAIVSLDDITAGGLNVEAFEAKKDRLARVKLHAPDKWRGLVQLVHDGGPKLAPPATGMLVKDLQKEPLGLTYGYSPAADPAPLTTALYPPPADDDPAFQFFFRSPFPAILGAPITDLSGALVGLTSLRHPAKPAVTLVVPPAACAAYVRARQAPPTP